MEALDERTRHIMTASYALPDLETVVQQVIYNAIDAHAKTIKLSIDIATASLVALDDGCGIRRDNLSTCVGECYASSKRSIAKRKDTQQIQQSPYGSRGAFLYELISLATTVEIESRFQGHWACYRKVFKDGKVVFNAKMKDLRMTPGTKIYVSNLFGMLPVRRKELSRNTKHQTRVVRNIQSFCVSMSMIWPSLAFDIRFQGGATRPVLIAAAKSYRERLVEHFGLLLGNQLQYVTFSSKTASFAIRGYFALVYGACETMAQEIKQAKSYYQFAFLDNKWDEECHQMCSRTITEAAIEVASAIPIFVLKVEATSDQYDVSGLNRQARVQFKAPHHFRQFLVEFVKNVAAVEANHVESDLMNSAVNSTLEHGVHEDTADLQYDEQCAVENGATWSSRGHNLCQACGHVNRHSSGTTRFDDNDAEFSEELLTSAASWGSEAFESFDFASKSLMQEHVDTGISEDALEDIFFSHDPSSFVIAKPTDEARDDVEEIEMMPWISSKPDAYDCTDVLLELCQENDFNEGNDHADSTKWTNEDDEQSQDARLELVTSEQMDDDKNMHSALHTPKIVSTTSSYFSRQAFQPSTTKSFTQRHGFKMDSIKRLAATLHVENVHALRGDGHIKISKSTLAKLQVIRQVDRKFLLCQADTCQGKLVLCIDQHAADERVLLEKLEADLFHCDGSLRHLDTHDFDPPLALQVNSKEREVLQYKEKLVKKWGFDFELIVSEPEQTFVNACKPTTLRGNDRVVLYAAPKVEKRAANSSDFRDFLELLSNAGETYLHSQIRPPVITRLLHSRACRSAIMFGDRLSHIQCQELIEELKMCQLPFQCAHGRPSVVPLVEIRNANFTSCS